MRLRSRCLNVTLEDGLYGELEDAVNTRLLLLDLQHTDVVLAVSSIRKFGHDYRCVASGSRNLFKMKQ